MPGKFIVRARPILLVLFSFIGFPLCAQIPTSVDVDHQVESVLSSMSLEEKISLLGGEGLYTHPLPRLSIPALRLSDGPVGVHAYGPVTSFSAGIALAATWDTELARRVGTVMGQDARARGVHFVLGPGVNIYRAPMNGRNFEYLGEDPFLASRMVVPLIQGIQSQGVIATVKHFAVNNQEYDRMKISSDLDERTLREIYLPAFEAAVREGKVGAVMDAYNLVNGQYMTENAFLNKQILKTEWQFDGILMSDWTATHNFLGAANGGLDMEMPSAVYMNAKNLLPAIKRREVSVQTIDDKVRRILRKSLEFSLFQRSEPEAAFPLLSQPGREAALQEALESIVLLKNKDQLLPLDPHKVHYIAVLGPDAYPAVVGGGGSSESEPFHAVSFLEGVSDFLGANARVLSSADEIPLEELVKNTEFFLSPKGSKGIRAEFFSNPNLTGKPALVRTDEHASFDCGEGSYADGAPADHFSARWTGYFRAQSTDLYAFQLVATAGSRLYVDDKLVIDATATRGRALHVYSTRLDAEHLYKVVIQYFKTERNGYMRLAIAPRDHPFYPMTAGHPMGITSVEAAAKADAVLVFLGFNPALEGEAFDRSFALPDGQEDLLNRILAVNKNTIVVLTAGGNVDVTRWIDRVPAVLHTWYPGQEGGTALARIVFGQFNPSGKLPVTFEKRWEDNPVFRSYYPEPDEHRVVYKEGVFLGYRHFDQSDTKPMFPFGFGLSYTTFAFSNLEVSPDTTDLSSQITVSFDIRNTGAIAGAEVAQVYVGDAHSPVPRPVKELKGFQRVELNPGETKRATVSLDRRAFSYFDVSSNSWKAQPGLFSILVGDSSADPLLQGELRFVDKR